jgi:hypothetical protein
LFAAEAKRHDVVCFDALEQTSLPAYPQGTRSNPQFRW